MGLDMYLTKKTYIKNWDYMKPEEKHIVEVRKGGKICDQIKQERVSEIIEEVGYWRKANAIHNWIVDNVQDGEDKCQESYFSNEKMEELLGVVNTVLKASKLIKGSVENGTQWTKEGGEIKLYEDGMVIKDPTVAAELLPTQSGFFFGGTGYDEYYIKDLKYTKKVLEDCLKEGGEYYYQASW